MKIKQIVITISLLAFIPLLKVSAATNPTGLSLSPAYQRLQLLPGEANTLLEFRISNNESTPQTIKLTTADFNSLNETGGLLFVGANPTDLQKKYGLAKWINLPQNSITINPKQSVKVKATIENRSDLSPGGHYGALMVTFPSSTGSVSSVSLKPVASALLFVDKVGGDTHKLALDSVDMHRRFLGLPNSANLRFHNIGNTELIPRGSVEVYSPRGHLVSKGIINDASSLILPETYRRYGVDIKSLASARWPGRYRIVINYRFDGYSGFRTYQTSFIYFPILSMLFLISLAVVAFIAVKGLKERK